MFVAGLISILCGISCHRRDDPIVRAIPPEGYGEGEQQVHDRLAGLGYI